MSAESRVMTAINTVSDVLNNRNQLKIIRINVDLIINSYLPVQYNKNGWSFDNFLSFSLLVDRF
jgi:hypothetical protein